ncbi:acriflavine resistance protein B [Aminobacter sp. Y103A]|uniref:efflux RND transporter permease subunit n=1 Tax=unclassified Aminobacter TaxID=2644704 RepID=UPI0012AF6347|nr:MULTISPECIES: efflux RND transporter permease subunit [unclassified Aminobacter]MRX34944.1 MMPL family transporter [Aminobacter sp. MDW-2]QNH33692.1 efflux RND transporter permease subunit [Aminobacter sp. MDW-2]BBD36771.1 acriflavine resistance protein B [Aminobacter sp. SS-2016]
MSFSDIFIRRPVLSTVVALMILLLGFQGLFNLSVRQYPKVEETVITITTVYPGASADLIQGFITAPIAAAVATTENIDYVTSQSRPSSSTVTVQMELGSNPDTALTEVMSKVQQVRGQLPSDAKDPTIVKGTGQQFAIMYLAMQNPNMSSEELTEYIQRVIRPRMSTIEGVAEVQVLGAANYSMRVWVDPVKLAARGLTAAEVLQAINASNFLSAPGKTKNEYVAYSITMKSTLQTPESFGELPLKSDNGNVVRLRDVAHVELAAESTDTVVNFNGQPGTFIGIFPTPSANPLNTAAAVINELPAISASLPQGMTITMVYDSTETISASIEEVFKTIAEAVAIVIVVILLFLGSFRSVLMPVVTIPLSLIGVCFILLMMGYSINLLSLLAMVLAIGLVVDDAIVVVENIHRHMEEGMSPMQAAFKGMREIFGPVVAMTITLAAVFAPLAFTGGLTGSLFREFAVTLAGAVILSGFIAVTITPMMSARMLKAGNHSRFAQFVDRSFERIANRYERLVAGSLKYRPVTLLIVVALVGVTGFMFFKTSNELAPEEDQGALFALVTAPRYATTEYTTLYTDQIRDLTKDLPELKTSFSIVGMGGATNSGFTVWVLKDWADRTRSQKEIQADIQARLSKVSGVEALVFAPPSLPGAGGGLPISMVIQSTGDPSQVFEVAEQIKQKAQASGRFIVVQNSLSFDAPQVTVTIDRDRAAALNLSVRDIGTTLSLLVGGGSIAEFDRDSNSYDIIMQVPEEYRNNPEKLGEFFVRSVNGQMVPLSAVVSIRTNSSPASIEQFNQLNSATISALPVPGVTTGDGLTTIEEIARPLLPAGFFIDYSGQSRLESEQGSTILIAFGLAIVVIYLVLAAQFESFRDPFIIMMSVPLSIFGAIVPLNLGLGTLNIYTQVGLITLIGLITKHGILLVEFANQQREEHGLSRSEAIIASAKVRLRPILMTTAAMALGVVPLIIASGAGAAARYSMGLVIFCGVIVGTIFTLFVVPMFYTFISRKDLAAHVEEPDAAQMAEPAHHH